VTDEAPAFGFGTAGRVIFGSGRAAELGTLISDWGSRALICTGSRPQAHQALLASVPIPTEVFTVIGEPTVEMARAAVVAARAHEADVVVAIGGGSVLDVGKAVAMLLGNGGDPLDYLEVIGAGRPVTRPAAPFLAMPTTAGTGAEVTENAVLASPEHGRKASLRSPLMLPRIALVDPLLTLDCPPAVTASSGLDALTQCLEPFVSPQASPLTDALAREGLSRASTGLRSAYVNGTDIAARTDMALCSLLGGMSLANAKLGAVHGFAGVIGGMVDAPHGAICAALLAAVAEVNVRVLRLRDPASIALVRYREAATLLTGRSDADVDDGIDWLRQTVAVLGIPGLGALGVRPDMADEIVAKTGTASSTKGNPVVLTDGELRAALDTAFG
jgi:alcohol dehydrogenase class IV